MRARLLSDDPGGALGPALIACLCLGSLGAAASLALGQEPLAMPPWLPVDPAGGLAASLTMGACLAGAMIVATRFLVARFAWARELQGELQPAVRRAGDGTLLLMALASGIAEELVFRGALMQGVGGWLGLMLSTAAFGVVHQTGGRSRLAWALWAGVMGAFLGLVFGLTGSLYGAILAHVAVNAVNLRFLRDSIPPQPDSAFSAVRDLRRVK